MRSLSCLKEVQHLNEKLAALSPFLSKLVEKSKSLFRLLKGTEVFKGNDEWKTMFTNIKREISSLPILVSPPPHSTLALYFVVSNSAISFVLVYEDGKKQSSIYLHVEICNLPEISSY